MLNVKLPFLYPQQNLMSWWFVLMNSLIVLFSLDSGFEWNWLREDNRYHHTKLFHYKLFRCNSMTPKNILFYFVLYSPFPYEDFSC